MAAENRHFINSASNLAVWRKRAESSRPGPEGGLRESNWPVGELQCQGRAPHTRCRENNRLTCWISPGLRTSVEQNETLLLVLSSLLRWKKKETGRYETLKVKVRMSLGGKYYSWRRLSSSGSSFEALNFIQELFQYFLLQYVYLRTVKLQVFF